MGNAILISNSNAENVGVGLILVAVSETKWSTLEDE